MSESRKESDLEDARDDDLLFRTCSAILKALPARDLPLFPRTQRVIEDQEIKLETAKSHKIAFLLARPGEVVAVMPLARNDSSEDFNLALALNEPGIDFSAADPYAVCANPRRGEQAAERGEGPEFLSVQYAVMPPQEGSTEIWDYMASHWGDIPFAKHVGLFQTHLHRVQSDEEGFRRFATYCHLSAAPKNKKRLTDRPQSGGVLYLTVLEEMSTRKLPPLPQSSRPYEGRSDFPSSYITSNDPKEMRQMGTLLCALLPKAEGDKLSKLFIFTHEASTLDLHRKTKNSVIQQLLNDGFKIFVALLSCTKTVYDNICPDSPVIAHPRKTVTTPSRSQPTPMKKPSQSRPSPALLRTIGDQLRQIGRFFYVMELYSRLLPWMLEVWLRELLSNVHERLEGEANADLPPGDEDEIDAEDLGDEDSEIGLTASPTLASKVLKFVRLCFATYRYARELSMVDKVAVGEIAIITVSYTDKAAEDWKQTIWYAYETHGEEATWRAQCSVVIDKIKNIAGGNDHSLRNWFKFSRQTPQVNDGVVHCEAALASLYLLAQMDGELPHPDLERLLAIVGPSKPCCPLCAIIIEEINWKLGTLGNVTIPILFTHTTPCTTALPPSLPADVRERILHRVTGKLFESLEFFRRRDRVGTHTSEQSEPLRDSVLLQEKGEVPPDGPATDRLS
ncbi:hypothetical protein BJ508DRAFT_314958 [Ascobolus immersus RN42]|uniref:Uncharacterized protein n=1 Tax=Ascobolus immersus RN42 TaxID=1160509 RepID=A0A3N4HEZ0_ASCIM|nr:hypothetical protein BJ508DRAFT_314958 [Ascobolus immersus RN42]